MLCSWRKNQHYQVRHNAALKNHPITLFDLNGVDNGSAAAGRAFERTRLSLPNASTGTERPPLPGLPASAHTPATERWPQPRLACISVI